MCATKANLINAAPKNRAALKWLVNALAWSVFGNINNIAFIRLQTD